MPRLCLETIVVMVPRSSIYAPSLFDQTDPFAGGRFGASSFGSTGLTTQDTHQGHVLHSAGQRPAMEGTQSLAMRQYQSGMQQKLRQENNFTNIRLNALLVQQKVQTEFTEDPKVKISIVPNSIKVTSTVTGPSSVRVVSGMSKTGDQTTPFEVGWEWLTGTGPRTHNFTNGDNFTELLRQHGHIEQTRQVIIDRIKKSKGKVTIIDNNPYRLSGIEGVPKYFKDYATLLTFGQTGNLAVTYLGSFTLQYSVTSVDFNSKRAIVKFSVRNSSTIASATRPPVLGYTKWWQTNVSPKVNDFFASGPLSRTEQIFEWTETLTWE